MNKVSVTTTDKKFSRDVKKISALARKVFLLLKKDNFSADIYLVSNSKIRSVNKKYRHKDKATNVLSFCEPKEFISPLGKYKYLGEIYLALDFIEKNEQNIKLMIVHGILHLFGYDHMTHAQMVRMEKLESRILKHI